MKKGMYALVILTIIIGNLPLSFEGYRSQTASRAFIKGTISPMDAADAVRIVRAKDTLRTDIVWGNFSLQADPGTYKLIVNAKAPYRNVLLGNLEVKKDQSLNIGEIILDK